MFEMTIRSSGFEELQAKLDALINFVPDLSRIESQVREIVQEEHKRARLAGLDINGDILIPITFDTVRRRRQMNKGNGPPLAPDGEESRVIANFLVTTESHDGRLDIRVGYIAAPFFEDMHQRGGPHLPPRNVVGIQKEALERIRDLFVDTVLQQIDEILHSQTTSPGILGRVRSYLRR